MPDTKSAGDEPEPTGKPGPKKMIVTAVLAVVLIGVGYVLGGQMGGSGAAVAEESAETAPEATEEGAEEVHVGIVVDLDAVNVNLADGHYLRVAISLGLSPDIDFGHGSVEDFPVAAASDTLLYTFSGRTLAELSSTEGREHARIELAEGLAEHYGEDVVSVYYTEFVMQ